MKIVDILFSTAYGTMGVVLGGFMCFGTYAFWKELDEDSKQIELEKHLYLCNHEAYLKFVEEYRNLSVERNFLSPYSLKEARHHTLESWKSYGLYSNAFGNCSQERN
jgi:hypothetical protein